MFFSSLSKQLVAEAGTDTGVSVALLQFPCRYTGENAVPGYKWGGQTEIVKTGEKKGTVRLAFSLFLR